jgi:transcriptional repressor NrdR
MNCPFCGFEDTKVIDSRSVDKKKRRRRVCTNCGKRFNTYEAVEKPLLMVEKKDGTYEPFDREKLIRGIFNAIKKRPVNAQQVSEIVDDIENRCSGLGQNQITSVEIGNLVLEHLKVMDPVGYIRFASVYKDFADVESFIKAISELDE